MTIGDAICVVVALAFVGFCIWLEARAVSRYRAKQAAERRAYLEVLWSIDSDLCDIACELRKANNAAQSDDVAKMNGYPEVF